MFKLKLQINLHEIKRGNTVNQSLFACENFSLRVRTFLLSSRKHRSQ